MKKGFTLIELLAVISILGILSGIAVTSFQVFTNRAKNQTYEDFEKTMKNAATNYFITETNQIPSLGEEKKILATTLIQEGLLETMVDPEQKTNRCDGESYVLVKQEASPNGYNLNLVYTPCLICSKYKSNSCR